jgi:hypothetical protein
MLHRFQFSLRKVLLLVGLIGAILGLLGRTMHQQRQHRRAEAKLAECQQATTVAYLRARTEIGHTLRPSLHKSSIWSRKQHGTEYLSSWREEFSLGRYVDSQQRQLEMLFHVEVEAVLRNGMLEPIIIRDRGGLHNDVLLAALADIYRRRHWDYQIIVASDTAEP